MNACVNMGEAEWNVFGGMTGVGEHMGEWEWPKDAINTQERTKTT